MPSECFFIAKHPVATSIFYFFSVTSYNITCFHNHRNDTLQFRAMRDRVQSLPFRLFLRCQCCSILALVKFPQKSQFSFLESSNYHRHIETQWSFQTKCRRCKEASTVPNGQLVHELNQNYISIDQVVRELSRDCTLVALHDDLMYFF